MAKSGAKSGPLQDPRRFDASVLSLCGRVALIGLGVALIAGCGRGRDWRQTQAPVSAAEADPDAGYVRPPQVIAAVRGGDGAVTLSGHAEPNSRVRLLSADGSAYGGTVAANGVWSMAAPAGLGIFGLSEDLGGRIVQAEGYIVVLPPPGRPAALLRGGGGAEVLDAKAGALRITAADYDSGGGAVVSGLAQPGEVLHLMVDGDAAPGEAKADAKGRFFIGSPVALKPGAHELRVQGGAGVAKVDIAVQPPVAISGLPLRAARQGDAWRIDWMTPAGGLQTSLILDP